MSDNIVLLARNRGSKQQREQDLAVASEFTECPGSRAELIGPGVVLTGQTKTVLETRSRSS